LGDSSTPKRLITFLLLTLGFSSVFWYLMIAAGSLSIGGGLYVLGLMWSPGVAAMLTVLLFQGNLRGLGWGWGKTRYQAISYLLPLGYAAVVYVPVWLLGLGGLNSAAAQDVAARWGVPGASTFVALVVFLLLAGTITMIGSCISALGEEIGWRGFLVPELAKTMSFAKVSLVSGFVWAAWHYPLILFADYRGATPRWFSLTCFTLMVVGISFAYAWLRLKSGSLWTGMWLHASHNLFVQSYFDRLTIDTGPTRWITGEFGIGLVIVTVLVAVYYWRKAEQLPEAA
jgi:membrane protease YdiL (CAAX protease family)